MFFSSEKDAYFFAAHNGQPVDKKGRPVKLVGQQLIANPQNKYEGVIRHTDKLILVLTTTMTAGAYAWARIPDAFAAFLVFLLLAIIVRVFLRYHGASKPKPNQIVAENVSRLDFLLKQIGYKAIFSDLGRSKMFFGNLFVVAFMLLLAAFFYGDERFWPYIIFWFIIGFSVILLTSSILFVVTARAAHIFYLSKPNLPDALLVQSGRSNG